MVCHRVLSHHCTRCVGFYGHFAGIIAIVVSYGGIEVSILSLIDRGLSSLHRWNYWNCSCLRTLIASLGLCSIGTCHLFRVALFYVCRFLRAPGLAVGMSGLIIVHDGLINIAVHELTLPACTILLVEQRYAVVHLNGIILVMIIWWHASTRALLFKHHPFHALCFLNVHGINLSLTICLLVIVIFSSGVLRALLITHLHVVLDRIFNVVIKADSCIGMHKFWLLLLLLLRLDCLDRSLWIHTH